jgi:hypothetical protein
MKQNIGLALALAGLIAWASLPALGQSVEPQAQSFLASFFSSGPKEVTISNRSGQVLSVLDVPAGVAVSIHLIKGEFTQPDQTGTVTFTGDVSIRTRPRSELVEGPSRDQMMKAPLKLDVQDALVVLAKTR